MSSEKSIITTAISISLTVVIISLVSTSVFMMYNISVYAQEYDQYYEYEQYKKDYKSDEPVIIIKNEPIQKKEMKEMKEPPMLLVNKEILFCDVIANGTSDFCELPLPGPDSDRYVQECTSEICQDINPTIFDIKITPDIVFEGSEEGTKLNFNGERFTVTEERTLMDEEFVLSCQEAGFDDGVVEFIGSSSLIVGSCVLFEGECSGFIQDKELKECTVKNFIVEIQEDAPIPNNVVITWEERLPEGNGETFAAMSMDSGATFGTGFNVSDTDTDSRGPQVAMSGDNVVITWREDHLGGNFETFAAMSMDGGATFGTGFTVSDTDTNSFSPKVAMSGDNVVITWRESLPGNNDEIFAAMSMNSGATFGTGFNVSETSIESRDQQVAMSGDNVVITWTEVFSFDNEETFAAMSMDGGATFGTAFNVSDTDTGSFVPQVAMSGNNVVITWEELLLGGNSETFAAMSMDGGATFGTGFTVSDTDTDSFSPKVAMSGDNVVITWREVLPGNNGETFAAMSMDGGATFGTAFNVSDTDTNSEDPQVAMSGDNVVITWEETLLGGNSETFAAMSMDGGATFGTAFNVSDTDTNSENQQVAIN
ncbi:MAG: hypothetical protein ACPKQO_02140 [Nitrososphaeraceae archaeon]